MIRAANKSDRPLNNVVIHFSSVDREGKNATHQTVAYGDLAPTEASEYRLVKGSFRYAPLEALLDGKQVRALVTDFVGEYAIPKGNYTYELTYGPNPMNGDREGLAGQLVYDQTPLDRAIDSAIDDEIAIAILNEYYRESPPMPETDSDDYSTLRNACVHQQTHQGTQRGMEATFVVYATIICKATSDRSSIDRELEDFNNAFPLPIRIELHKQDDTFTVVNYQFPRKGSDYKRDIEKIFSSTAANEIAEAKIAAATHNYLALKLM